MDKKRTALSVFEVTKRFGNFTALNGVTLKMEEGASIAIFGPNGAGKTTLLKILATLWKPATGKVTIKGIDALKNPERVRAEIGIIFHQSLLYEDLTAHENLVFYGRMYGLEKPKQRAEIALEKVHLWDHKNDRVKKFSRGMKQRLAIARATLHRPSLLLLDEPFNGLDTSGRKLLIRILSNLQQERRSLLLVTHDFKEGITLTNRFEILDRGQLVEGGKTKGMTEAKMQAYYKTAVLERESYLES